MIRGKPLPAEANRIRSWRRAGAIPVVLDLLVVITLLTIPVIWLMDPLRLGVGRFNASASWGLKPVLFLFLVLLVRRVTVRGSAGLLPRTPVKLLLLVIYPAWIFLLLAEGVLALAGYSRPLPPIVIRGESELRSPVKYPAFAGDAELGWVLIPGASFQGRTINQLGFLDREVSERKARATRRVICMGDSCTAQGNPPYSGYLHELLTEKPVTPETWEAFNVGVHGYSSWQGLKLYRRRVRSMQGDLVTLFFGWNDHWSTQIADSIRYPRFFSPFVGKVLNALQRKRFYSLMVHALRGRPRTGKRERIRVRVPPEEYVRNLRKLVDEIRGDGAIPILITAPRTERLTGRIIRANKPRNMKELLALHDDYADLTRRVAREKKVELLDLATLLVGPEGSRLFMRDGVHFRQEGLERIAAEIHARLLSMAERGAL